MTPVAQAIVALLYDHNVVIVPGLGAFLSHEEGAKVNVITNQFERPTAILSFDPQRREDNDLIVNWLRENKGLAEDEAEQMVTAFVSNGFAKMQAGDMVRITGVGTLSFDQNQQIVFTAVASNQYNGDAFGLDDFVPSTVNVSGNQEDWRNIIAQQTKDLNTPMTVDYEKVDEEGYWRRRRRRMIFWFVLSALLLLVGAFVLLCYLKIIPLKWPSPKKPIVVVAVSDTVKKPDTTPVVDTLPMKKVDTMAMANDSLTVTKTQGTVDQPVDTPVQQPSVVETVTQEPVTESLLITPPPTVKVFIVGGCYSNLENAETQVKAIRELGFEKSFVMKRGEKFFVCYGQYASTQDAKSELPSVRESNPKAWILVKK